MQDVIDAAELRTAIAANVTRLRREKDLSQEEFADKLGVSRVQINRIENGKHSPSAEMLFTLADALGVSTDSLRQVPSNIHA